MHKIQHTKNIIVELLTNTYVNPAAMLDSGGPSCPHAAGLDQHVTKETPRLKQKLQLHHGDKSTINSLFNFQFSPLFGIQMPQYIEFVSNLKIVN